jgi:phosphoglycolate phosphatase
VAVPRGGDRSASILLFDLDGTLSDSAPGILAALRHAFEVTGLPQLDPLTERSLLGPPFYESLPPLIGEHMLAPVLAAYREHYGAGGMLDATAYAGIPEVLSAARGAGLRLAVATSKPEHYAVPIIDHLGLTAFFDTVGGDELDGSLRTKALVIGKVLHRLGQPDPGAVLMVGDREHDVAGARTHDIRCVGAGWGYGRPGELVRAGAHPICATALELIDVLGLGGTSGAAAS